VLSDNRSNSIPEGAIPYPPEDATQPLPEGITWKVYHDPKLGYVALAGYEIDLRTRAGTVVRRFRPYRDILDGVMIRCLTGWSVSKYRQEAACGFIPGRVVENTTATRSVQAGTRRDPRRAPARRVLVDTLTFLKALVNMIL